ncbi:hypothetical protein [Neisseria sp. Ec49-e6-T10]|uniref:hypothetical protein n=1 Tax=Neisseria sp. Ec49-e6-T10 TaxID=3140744 RepID=UPI003EB8E72B
MEAAENWCISADGSSVIKADDFYVGNYGAKLLELDKQINNATDETVKAKLLRMKTVASSIQAVIKQLANVASVIAKK